MDGHVHRECNLPHGGGAVLQALGFRRYLEGRGGQRQGEFETSAVARELSASVYSFSLFWTVAVIHSVVTYLTCYTLSNLREHNMIPTYRLYPYLT